jgi:hypothetical protein
MLEERIGGSPLVERLKAEFVGLNQDVRTHAKLKAAA